MTTTGRDITDEAPVGTTITTGPRRRGPTRIPSSRYISPHWAELELTRLWPRTWQIACTVDHVPEPGDFYEYQCGPLSVLIVRGDDGELRAFQNVCRHRGNELCRGTGSSLTELRCGYHRWTWDLRGRLREVPSRKGFGALRNDDLPLIPVQAAVWAGLVFVNLDLDAEPLESFLEGVPDDIDWIGPDDFRCTYLISIPMSCNWKVLIEGFSETYHVQGIHREMLLMCDDVNSPQRLWNRHGKLEQPYGLASPRLRDGATDGEIWSAFVAVMGTRVGQPDGEHPGPPPPVPPGQTMRDVLEGLVRAEGARRGLDFSPYDQRGVMNLFQYNVFPNATVLFMADLKQVVRARPGPTPDCCTMDAFVFERRPSVHSQEGRGPSAGGPGAGRPVTLDLPPDQPQLGLVLNQDVFNLQRAQRGLHQPGLTHIVLSAEECRIINLHRNLERYLGVPTEIEEG